VRGDAEIYLHTGGQYDWDSCALAAVALAHGSPWQPHGRKSDDV